MLARQFYYSLKPFLPWHLRMAVRRIWARRIRRRNEAVWPIDASTSTKPPGWPGWPGGKRFAVVLTHDIEGPQGAARCQALAESEAELGFRSSFNFIPEGTYLVAPQLRSWLTEHGFEVGVHDLEHDGRLYTSESDFAEKARRINHYLKEWGAQGFRSGFMLRNLDWLHQLNISYDCSTFDTDPFEPQPDAAGTIFPFWVARGPISQRSTAGDTAGSPGYVELPYTLPQDSTLFLVHREKTDTIWREKLDWVAAQGGMVLLNVHPDYLHFSNGAGKKVTTVRDHYFGLLRYLRSHYAGAYWHALPKDVAAFVQEWRSRQGVALEEMPK